MNQRNFPALRAWLTVLATFAELTHLGWQHFNGGVVSHHFLHRADMPAVSNAWGLLVLPALAWFLSGIALKRTPTSSVVAGFIGSLTLGTLLAVCFTQGYETATSSLFLGICVLALFLRVYRAECLLGFVLGMAFTFGAVLPTIIGSLIAALSAFVHLGIRPVLMKLIGKSKRPRLSD